MIIRTLDKTIDHDKKIRFLLFVLQPRDEEIEALRKKVAHYKERDMRKKGQRELKR